MSRNLLSWVAEREAWKPRIQLSKLAVSLFLLPIASSSFGQNLPSSACQSSTGCIYFDSSESMRGYVRGGSKSAAAESGSKRPGELISYRRFLDALRTSIASTVGRGLEFRFAEDRQRVWKIAGSATPLDESFYRDSTTHIEAAIGQSQADTITVVVTDLFQDDGDIPQLVDSLRINALQKGMVVAIVGVNAPFNGHVYPGDMGSPTKGVISLDGSMPIYALIIGKRKGVQRVLNGTIQSLRGESKDEADIVSPVAVSIVAKPEALGPGSRITFSPARNTPIIRTEGVAPLKDDGRRNFGYWIGVGSPTPPAGKVSIEIGSEVTAQGQFSDELLLFSHWARPDVRSSEAGRYSSAATNLFSLGHGEYKSGKYEAQLVFNSDNFKQGDVVRVALTAMIRPSIDLSRWNSMNIAPRELQELRNERDPAAFKRKFAPNGAGKTPNLISFIVALQRLTNVEMGLAEDGGTVWAPNPQDLVLYVKKKQ